MPEYVSTRSLGEDKSKNFSEVLLEGLAPDGGLYSLAEYPHLGLEEIKALEGLPYHELFVKVKSLLVGDSIELSVQKHLAATAYDDLKFPLAENGNIVPLRQIASNLFVQNLSLGPTAAFKDMALQAVGQDMSYELGRQGDRRLRILGATSGDTGSAAEAATKGLGGISLFMLSPIHGMSEFQRAQMGELSGDNIHNIAVDERFDVLQRMVKELNSDPEFADLGAVNSINWDRVASQIPYYFSGYLQAVKGNIGQEVDFVVPSGNMGNALAGYIARKMGLPIRTITIATNENSVLDRLIQTGVYKNTGAQITSSPSMDIAVASNYERVVYDLLDHNPITTRQYMEQFEYAGLVDFRDIAKQPDLLKKAGFDSGTSNHEKRINTIRRVYKEAGTVIDPHTADGVGVAFDQNTLDVPTICMETALPVKFEPMIQEALGFVPQREERFEGLESGLGERFVILKGSAALRYYIRNNS